MIDPLVVIMLLLACGLILGTRRLARAMYESRVRQEKRRASEDQRRRETEIFELTKAALAVKKEAFDNHTERLSIPEDESNAVWNQIDSKEYDAEIAMLRQDYATAIKLMNEAGDLAIQIVKDLQDMPSPDHPQAT